ncbi:MAG TPA: hypothetical protein VHD87_05140 [Acidimicrobiales bacterium]|nr:hypothetical protein [Acidimicrobiales bacterium]
MHYAANKRRYIDNANAWKLKLGDRRARWLLEYLAAHPCVDCGESDPVVLDFDHRRDKLFEIGRAIFFKSMEAILEEIEKCDVVCANCHRRRTARRGRFARVLFVGWKRLPLSFPEVSDR